VLALPGVVPKLSLTPGTTRRNAPALGQDTDDVLRGIGLSADQIRALKETFVVGGGAL
jgi:formyl-CoA transferase